MRLKRLKILGFKSFADEVILDFDAAIIALVGPNGCGKSNIVDAFRWVLGEQSARELRGDKMHDVLFAGGEKRKPQNMAEVSVTLTDVEGLLPIECDEIVISRKLYRSGESEYLINKERVRLKDVQSIFMGSGIGKNAFSIFEQGKLDQIIHLNASERRHLFDETAGIGRFLLQKKEALKSLDEVAINFNRIQDVHAEIDKRRRLLKKQAAEAQSYQARKERLEQLEKAVIIAKYQKQQARALELQEGLDNHLEEMKKAHETLMSLENLVEENKKLRNLKEQKASLAQTELYQKESTLKIKSAEERKEKERLSEIEARVKRVQNELGELKKRREKLLFEIEERKNSHAKLEAQGKFLEEESQKSESAYLELQKRASELEQEGKIIQQEELKALEKQNTLLSELSEKKVRQERVLEQLDKIEKNLEQKASLILEKTKSEEVKRAEFKELSMAIDEAKEQTRKLEKKTEELSHQIKSYSKEFEPISRSIQEKKAHEKALINLRSELEGFSNGARALLKESQKIESPLYQKLSPLYDALVLKEKGLSLALRPYTATFVVKNREDQKLVLDFAFQKKWRDFSLFVQKDLLEDLSEHFLKNVQITQEGYLIDQKGVLFSELSSDGESNAFLREAKLKEIHVSLVELESQANLLQESLSERQKQKAEVEKQRAELEQEWRKKEMSHVKLNFLLQGLITEIKKTKEEQLQQQAERSHLQKTLELAQKELETLSEAFEKLKIERSQKEKLSGATLQLLHEKREALKVEFALCKKNEGLLAAHLAVLRTLKEEMKIFEAKDGECETQATKLEKELDDIQKGGETRALALVALAQELKADALALQEQMSEQMKTKREYEEAKSEDERVEKLYLKERKAYEGLESKKSRLMFSFEEVQTTLRGLQKEMSARFQSAIEVEQELDVNIEESEKAIITLRYELDKDQSVNLTSIEESTLIEERFSQIDKQLIDLRETKVDLEAMISKLDQESRKLFKATFEMIRENFQKNFALLFNGGKADLKFTESPDILEAGIEIIAEPPGKQMRSISLLSGGEKCMTALALLFSFFEVRPAPFCILDEVDAPLDESNIERFTNVLRQFTMNTQFIIVTHNKKTMGIADTLFGVSMEEKGVSKLLSLMFKRDVIVDSA